MEVDQMPHMIFMMLIFGLIELQIYHVIVFQATGFSQFSLLELILEIGVTYNITSEYIPT